MAKKRESNGHMRTRPVQQRSTETMEKILETSLQVLEEGGLSSFNTNAVASAAKVNVGTLYHYFPDKESILRELFERIEAERLTYLREKIAEYPDVTGINAWVTEVVRTLAKMRRNRPGASVLRHALRVVPDLQQLEEMQDAESAKAFAKVLMLRHKNLSITRATNAAHVVISLGVSVLDQSEEIGTSSSAIEKELVAVITSYLESLNKN